MWGHCSLLFHFLFRGLLKILYSFMFGIFFLPISNKTKNPWGFGLYQCYFFILFPFTYNLLFLTVGLFFQFIAKKVWWFDFYKNTRIKFNIKYIDCGITEMWTQKWLLNIWVEFAFSFYEKKECRHEFSFF